MVDTGRKGILLNVRGEAVVILMAAMMVGGFLFWLMAGHHRGMHGGSREGANSRPAAAVASERKSPQEVSVRGGSPAGPPEEVLEKDRGVR